MIEIMTELWQLYDEEAHPIAGLGASKEEMFSKGLLHGAAHVWLWRQTKDGKQVMVQKRAANKRTWPSLLDISAAGHIDLGESPKQAAVRETEEEIGIDITPEDLQPIGRHRFNFKLDNQNTENEYRWVYLRQVDASITFNMQQSEVASIQWMALPEFRQAVLPNKGSFVPQGDEYFQMLIKALSSTFQS